MMGYIRRQSMILTLLACLATTEIAGQVPSTPSGFLLPPDTPEFKAEKTKLDASKFILEGADKIAIEVDKQRRVDALKDEIQSQMPATGGVLVVFHIAKQKLKGMSEPGHSYLASAFIGASGATKEEALVKSNSEKRFGFGLPPAYALDVQTRWIPAPYRVTVDAELPKEVERVKSQLVKFSHEQTPLHEAEVERLARETKRLKTEKEMISSKADAAFKKVLENDKALRPVLAELEQYEATAARLKAPITAEVAAVNKSVERSNALNKQNHDFLVKIEDHMQADIKGENGWCYDFGPAFALARNSGPGTDYNAAMYEKVIAHLEAHGEFPPVTVAARNGVTPCAASEFDVYNANSREIKALGPIIDGGKAEIEKAKTKLEAVVIKHKTALANAKPLFEVDKSLSAELNALNQRRISYEEDKRKFDRDEGMNGTRKDMLTQTKRAMKRLE